MTDDTQMPRRGLSRREWLWLGAGILLAIGIIVAVASLTKDSQPNTNLVEINRPAPDVTLQTLDGSTINLADLRGKIVLVNFWASWCEPCKEEMPTLVQASKDYSDQMVVVGINATSNDPNMDDIRRFVQRYGVPYQIALDPDGIAQRAFAIYPLPVSYFIDSRGVIRYTRTTAITRAEIDRVMQTLTP